MTEEEVLIRVIDGSPVFTPRALALLFGVPVKETEQYDIANGVAGLPPEWVANGHRRAAEARAYTRSNNVINHLKYWAWKEGGVVITEPTPGDTR